MIGLVLALLLALCLVSLLFAWRRFLAVGLVLLTLWFLAFAAGPATWVGLQHLQASYQISRGVPPWCGRSAIVLLGAGTQSGPSSAVDPTLFGLARIERGAEVFRSCRATGADCTLIVSGGDPSGTGRSEAAIYGERLEKLGIPASALILEPESRNTWQNAAFASRLLTEGRFERAVLVTSAWHMRRAQLYFRHFAVQTSPAPADALTVAFWPPSFARNLATADLVAHEGAGLLRYRIYSWLGLNPPAVPIEGAATCTPPSAGRGGLAPDLDGDLAVAQLLAQARLQGLAPAVHLQER